jgi:hypothetical protein
LRGVLDTFSRRVVGWSIDSTQTRHFVAFLRALGTGCYKITSSSTIAIVDGIDTHKDLIMAALVDRDDSRLLG